jgi:hypothetical protein
MNRRIRIATGMIASAIMLTAPAFAQAHIEETQTITLRAHEKNISGYAGPLHTKHRLPTGKLYVAQVSGSISYYATKQYKHPSTPWNTICGEPVGGPRRPLGIDAEFVFGRPWTNPCPLKLPVHWKNFEISTDNGGAYSHPAPFGAPFSAPTPGHNYTYPLVGSNKYALFRLHDAPGGNPATWDNYGALTINIRPAVPADCSGTGYLTFGEPSEAACVAAT